jgi:hypothetical protein
MEKRPSARQSTTQTNQFLQTILQESETTFHNKKQIEILAKEHAIPNYGISSNGD